MKLIKKDGTWTLVNGNNFASIGVGFNPRTGGYPTAKMVRMEFPERIKEATELLAREGTSSPYNFNK